MNAPLRIGLASAIGAAGGAVFYLLASPLPWMPGVLFATMCAPIAKAPVLDPVRARPAVVAVFGVLPGLRFMPDVPAQENKTRGKAAYRQRRCRQSCHPAPGHEGCKGRSTSRKPPEVVYQRRDCKPDGTGRARHVGELCRDRLKRLCDPATVRP